MDDDSLKLLESFIGNRVFSNMVPIPSVGNVKGTLQEIKGQYCLINADQGYCYWVHFSQIILKADFDEQIGDLEEN